MIRSVLHRAIADSRLFTPVFVQFGSGFATDNAVRIEKDALTELTSNEFGSLKGTQETYLRSESIADDEDGYDNLEIIRTKMDKFYHQNMLTKLIHSTPVRLKEALQVLDDMQRIDRRKPRSVHFTLAITGCAKVGYTEKAFELFDNLLKSDIKPTKATITSLFNACAECRNRDLAIEKANFLRDWIFQNSYVCNVKQFHAMIKAYARQGDVKTAFEVMKEMVDTGHATTTETFNMLLMGCVSNKQTGLLQAIKIVKKMISCKCVLDVYTYNLLLRCVRDCEIGSQNNLNDFFLKWTANQSTSFDTSEETLHTTDIMNENLKKLPFKVDYKKNELINKNEVMVTKSPNLLSTALSLAGQVVSINFNVLKESSSRLQLIGGCEGILQHMKCNNVQPTIATFSLLLECSQNALEEETKLVSLMQEYKVKPQADLFNQIIKRRSMRSDISGALKCLTQMQTLSLMPDVVTFGVLAMGCRTKQLGLSLIEDMEKAGFTLNIETVGALIKNACVNRDLDYLLSLMHIITAKQITVDSRIVENIVYCHEKVRDMLLQHEKRGEPIPERYLSDEFNETFRRFNLEFKKWLKTVNYEPNDDQHEQHRFQFSKPLRHKMYLFEKSMRQKIRDRVKQEIDSF